MHRYIHTLTYCFSSGMAWHAGRDTQADKPPLPVQSDEVTAQEQQNSVRITSPMTPSPHLLFAACLPSVCCWPSRAALKICDAMQCYADMTVCFVRSVTSVLLKFRPTDRLLSSCNSRSRKAECMNVTCILLYTMYQCCTIDWNGSSKSPEHGRKSIVTKSCFWKAGPRTRPPAASSSPWRKSVRPSVCPSNWRQR